MNLHQGKTLIDKIKDSLVDGCLLYDGAICVLFLAVSVSVMSSFSAFVLR